MPQQAVTATLSTSPRFEARTVRRSPYKLGQQKKTVNAQIPDFF
ncbi:hypothetical protein [Pseudanabaena cinerea]|nr:hypothetical protein [Pseudanabaena cinerea]